METSDFVTLKLIKDMSQNPVLPGVRVQVVEGIGDKRTREELGVLGCTETDLHCHSILKIIRIEKNNLQIF